MDGLNDISEKNTTKRDQPDPVNENICWCDFFRDAATQVDECDLLRAGLGEYFAAEISPPRAGICATGVAGTPVVGNCAQVFCAARLNTEPRLTFMFPSMRSAFDQPRNVPEFSSRADASEPIHNLFPTSLPPVTSLSVTPQNMTSLHVTSRPMTSLPTMLSSAVASVTMTSAKVTTVTMTFPPVTSVTMTTITSPQKTSSMELPPVTSVTETSLCMMSPPVTSVSMTSYPTTSNAVMTSTSFLPLLTTKGVDSSNKSKRLSPKLSHGREVNRSSRSPSPRLSPKQSNNRETADRSPSPQPRGGTSQRSIATASPTRPGTHDQSRGQTRDMTSLKKNQTSVDIHDGMKLRSPEKTPRRKSPREQITSEKGTSGQSTLGKGVLEQSPSEKSSIDKCTQGHISSEQSTPENSPSEKHPVPLTGSPVYPPEHKEIDIPLLSTFEGTSPPGNNLETSKTGSTSPEMTASTSTAGFWENEPSQHSVSGKKRRRTGTRSSGKGKRKKSRTMMDSKGDDRELRDRLPRRIWDGTSYKVEEVEGIDFTPELSRRASRPGNLGRVSPNPNTRLRSRKNSKVISTADAIPSDDVISTSGVMNGDVISNSDVISTNPVISRPLPESEGAEMVVL